MDTVEEYYYDSLYSNISVDECQHRNVVDAKIIETVGFTIASSILSLIGSALTILPFLLWRDVRRSTARKILLFLSIADFFTAAGYLAGGSAHYYFFSLNGALKHSLIEQFEPLCAAQSFIISFFSTASFFWTTYLAIYFVIVVVFGVYRWNRRLIVFFNLTAWPIPLAICTIAVSLKFLGIGETYINAAPGVCFVSSNHTILSNMSSKTYFNQGIVQFLVVEAVSMKLWEVIAMASISFCYLLIFVVNRCLLQRRYKQQSSSSPAKSTSSSMSNRTAPVSSLEMKSYSKSLVVKSIKTVDIKLLMIPVVFIFFRAWGTMRYFVSIWSGCHQYLGPHSDPPFCVNKACFDIFYHPLLLFAQAIFDPLQGFGNAILFVVLSKSIIIRLLSPCRTCRKTCQRQCACNEEYNPSVSDAENERGPLIEQRNGAKTNERRRSLQDGNIQMSLADYPSLNA